MNELDQSAADVTSMYLLHNSGLAPVVTPEGQARYKEAFTVFDGKLKLNLTLSPELIDVAEGVKVCPI